MSARAASEKNRSVLSNISPAVQIFRFVHELGIYTHSHMTSVYSLFDRLYSLVKMSVSQKDRLGF